VPTFTPLTKPRTLTTIGQAIEHLIMDWKVKPAAFAFERAKDVAVSLEVATMAKMRCTWSGWYFVLLALTSCGSPRAMQSADAHASTDGAGGVDAGLLPISLELLAGNIGGPGSGDGTGATARFRDPDGVAVDDAGNVYVADEINHTIRKVTAAGVVTTLAGTAGVTGSADGTGAAARFFHPGGMALDGAGNLYVADEGNHTIRMVTATGVVTTLAGAAGMTGSADGMGADARFNSPYGVALDGAGNVYVADGFNYTIRKITAAGLVTTLAGTAGMLGSADGTGAEARFSFPTGLAVDGNGNVYVADNGNVTIRKVTADGVVTTLAGTPGMRGTADGTGPDARFDFPYGVAVDGAGNVYVADLFTGTIRKVTADGVVTTLAGSANTSGSADGTGAAARFAGPIDLAVDSTGTVYVADQGNCEIRKVTAAGAVTTLAGAASVSGSADGTGAATRFYNPLGVAADGAGNVYVADQSNATIRKVTPTGDVTTLAGTAGMAGSMDRTGAAARFNNPAGVAVDGAGNIYVAEVSNSTIRKVTAAGVVTTLAGTAGMTGSADGTGAAARFVSPPGVAADGAGNLYVADEGNHTIRMVTAAGVVTTLAGAAGMTGSADGTGAAARFNHPVAVAVDGAGNLYVADQGNSTIRKVTLGGVVTTLAGTAGMVGTADGTGAAALFNHPTGLALDGAGNLYVADTASSTIRKITPAGITTTVAGTAGVAGILLGANLRLGFPQGLAIVGDSIVLSDTNAILLLRHGAQ